MARVRLALVAPHSSLYSQTFIRAHIELINHDIDFLYGGYVPRYSESNGSIMSSKPLSRVRGIIDRKLRGKTLPEIQKTEVQRYLLKTRPEVVLAEFGQTGVELFPVCAKLNIPLIVHFHGADAYQKKFLDVYGKHYPEMAKYASAVVSVSNEMTKQLIRLGIPKEKIVYNCYGPHDDFFTVDPQSQDPLFVAIGRFVDKKAPYYTLAAFHQVIREVPHAKLIMAGDGNLLFASKNLAKYWNIAHAVEFPGVVDRATVKSLFSRARAFVQHSIVAEDGDSEGTPVGILEASAAGLPIIATRHAGIKDVVVEDETGILVDEGAVNEMAMAMTDLAVDKVKAHKMGSAGRKRISDHFSMDRHIRFLDDLISKSKRNA